MGPLDLPSVLPRRPPVVPDVELACPRCPAGRVRSMARFELRLPDGLSARLTQVGSGRTVQGPDLASAMTTAAEGARVAAVGSDVHVIRIPDGQFVVRCPHCGWAHRFAPEQIRRAAVIRMLMKLQSPGVQSRPSVVSADVVASVSVDTDWAELLKVALRTAS